MSSRPVVERLCPQHRVVLEPRPLRYRHGARRFWCHLCAEADANERIDRVLGGRREEPGAWKHLLLATYHARQSGVVSETELRELLEAGLPVGEILEYVRKRA